MHIRASLKLSNNIEIPVFGLGTYLSKPGEESYNAVRYAIDEGYIHFDTAAFYQNEADIGKAIKDSGVSRDNLFVTTKVWNTDQGFDNTLNAFDRSMKKLDLDYIDLYLIHWPQQGTRSDTWKAIEKIYDSGKVNSIGVSNYTVKHLKELSENADILPMVNQVELSPYLYQKDLIEFSKELQIVTEAYSPLTRRRKFNDQKLVEIAEKYSKSPAQILIRWCLQKGLVVLPKSSNPERIKENANVFDFEINDNDISLLDSFNENFRIAWNPETVD